jgi:deazaflavin-dependent oxidoreductase (nitroreductase family)
VRRGVTFRGHARIEENEMPDASAPPKLPDWMADHVRRYQATDGADGHLWTPPTGGKPVPTLLLTTTGRKSKRRQVLPLIYGKTDQGYVVVASKGGAPSHPAWYLNLSADPEVEVQAGPEKFKARARITSGEERTALWKKMTGVWPPYDDYQRQTQREIPVVVLEPR